MAAAQCAKRVCNWTKRWKSSQTSITNNHLWDAVSTSVGWFSPFLAYISQQREIVGTHLLAETSIDRFLAITYLLNPIVGHFLESQM
jgi:hypothetical protein